MRADVGASPDASPVAEASSAKRARTSYRFRLDHTLSAAGEFQAVGGGAKRASGSAAVDRPVENTDKKRRIAPVRRFQLRRAAAATHPHPYRKARTAAFLKEVRDVTEDAEMVAPPQPSPPPPAPPVQPAPPAAKTERKRPRTHPREKAQFRDAEKQPEITLGYEDDEKMMRDMERLVLEYLDDDGALEGLPPTPVPPRGDDRVGGGVGGGSWDVAMGEQEEEEEGYVYDVYYREEVAMEGVEGPAAKEDEEYGVIVFAESEDEEWWYEGADDEDDRSDAYASDDEDSNGSCYHSTIARTQTNSTQLRTFTPTIILTSPCWRRRTRTSMAPIVTTRPRSVIPTATRLSGSLGSRGWQNGRCRARRSMTSKTATRTRSQL